MKICIKNGIIVNPLEILEADVIMYDGVIQAVKKGISEKTDITIDASGKHVFPGFIDLHAHLRTPGREDEEDLESGTHAAAKGGFTKIFCMPNTSPALDNDASIQWLYEQARKHGVIDVYPIGAITKNRQGQTLTEFGLLKKAGCLALSDDGNSLQDSLLMRRALEYAKMTDLLIISHCEDHRMANLGAMRESFVSSKYGISAIPEIAESLIVARDIEIARYLNARIHIAHVSTSRSVELIERAKQEGVRLTCETCPHYFVLTADDVEKNSFHGNFKVNPPLGLDKDIEKIKEALSKGVIDCIATDHAPHSQAEKELPFEEAPFGFTGLELAFSLVNTYLIKRNIIDLAAITQKLSFMPANIMGFKNCGKIEQGYCADVVVADINKRWTVKEDTIVSKSKNTPFLGNELDGVIEYTIHQGKIVYEQRA